MQGCAHLSALLKNYLCYRYRVKHRLKHMGNSQFDGVSINNMRKSFDGLCALVSSVLQENPTSGALFVFINRCKTHIKILYFDGSGFCLWFKRLEQGQFHYRSDGTEKQVMDWTQLKLLLDGLEVKTIRQYKRYRHAA